MAKDPAMLWYWSDWHSGTITLSRFLKGCYMDLLHAQFNSGHLGLEEIKTVLGSDFGQAWPAIQKKFAVDEAGKYFNVRLEEEKEKRAKYTASRRKNLKSSHMVKHKHKHMHTDMENEDVNENEIKIKKESLQDFTKPDVPGDVIVLPFETETMRRLWALWKEARWNTHGVRYPMNGEQADLHRLQGMTFQQVEETIQQAIAGGWKNLYPGKNGKQTGTKKRSNIDEIKQSIAEDILRTHGGG